MTRKMKAKTAAADVIPAARAALLDAVARRLGVGEVLRRLEPERQPVGAALMWLATRDADREVRNHASGLLVAVGKDPSLPERLSRRVLEQAVAPAQEALVDRAVPDEAKQLCLTVIDLAGAEPDVDDVVGCFQDFHGSLERMLASVAASLEDTADSVDAALAPTGVFDEDEVVDEARLAAAAAMCLLTCRQNPRVGATALLAVAALAHERGVTSDLLDRALEAAVQASPGRAAWLLDELGRWPAMGELGQAAREVAGELTCERQPMASPPVAQALVTTTDSSGSRMALVVLRRGDGAADALLLMLNDQVGIKDVQVAWEDGAEVLERLLDTRGVTLAPCGLELVRALVADALALHEDQGRPVPARLLTLRHLLGPEPLLPARRAPDLSTYGLETHARAPGMVGGSDELAEEPTFGCLAFASSAAYERLAAPAPRGRRPRRDVELDAFLGAVEQVERPLLVRRLATNLETLALAGKGRTHAAQVAVGVYVALSEALVPWGAVPYVRALAAASIERIRDNLRRGHRSEAEAFEAQQLMFDQPSDLPF